MISRSSPLTVSTAGLSSPSGSTDAGKISVRIWVGPCAWCACAIRPGIQTARCGGTIQVPRAVEIASTPLLGYTSCCRSW